MKKSFLSFKLFLLSFCISIFITACTKKAIDKPTQSLWQGRYAVKASEWISDPNITNGTEQCYILKGDSLFLYYGYDSPQPVPTHIGTWEILPGSIFRAKISTYDPGRAFVVSYIDSAILQRNGTLMDGVEYHTSYPGRLTPFFMQKK